MEVLYAYLLCFDESLKHHFSLKTSIVGQSSHPRRSLEILKEIFTLRCSPTVVSRDLLQIVDTLCRGLTTLHIPVRGRLRTFLLRRLLVLCTMFPVHLH